MSLLYMILADPPFWMHGHERFVMISMGVNGVRKGTPTMMLWMTRPVHHSDARIATHIGVMTITLTEELMVRAIGNTAYPAGAPRRANAPRPRPILIYMITCHPVALVEFITAGVTLGPPPRATHFHVEMPVSVAVCGRLAAMRKVPTIDAVPAVTGLEFRVIRSWRTMGTRLMPRGSGGTRGRAALHLSGWSRRHGFTCPLRASWAAGSCVMRRLATGTVCTAAAAWGTRQPLPR